MKSQVITLEFVMNTGIVFLLIAYTYLWSSDIFQNTLDRAKISKIEKHSFEMEEALERVLKTGGKRYFSFKIDGVTEIKKNQTSGKYFIEIKALTKKYRNTTWRIVNTRSFLKESTPFIIRERYKGNVFYLQIIPGEIKIPNEKIEIFLVPSFHRACSGECRLLIEKIGSERAFEGGKKTFVVKIRVGFK